MLATGNQIQLSVFPNAGAETVLMSTPDPSSTRLFHLIPFFTRSRVAMDDGEQDDHGHAAPMVTIQQCARELLEAKGTAIFSTALEVCFDCFAPRFVDQSHAIRVRPPPFPPLSSIHSVLASDCTPFRLTSSGLRQTSLTCFKKWHRIFSTGLRR
jgi:hypothetical protein